ADVTLIEQNKVLGKKLALTGGGRCNLTSSLPIEEFFPKVTTNPSFLYSSFYSFDNEALMRMFEEQGVALKTEGAKVYPVHESAAKIVSFLERSLSENGVRLLLGEGLLDFSTEGGGIPRIARVKTSKQILRADALIFATGGASFPATGSDGKIFSLLKAKGFVVTDLFPSLVQLFTRRDFSSLAGVSVSKVKLSCVLGKKKKASTYGDLLFTQKGVSGPAAMDMSSYLTKEEPDEVLLHIDFLPELKASELSDLLFSSSPKHLSTLLAKALPSRLAKFLMEDFDTKDKFNLSKEERKVITDLVKDFPLELKGYGSLKEAIVTKGGLDVREVSSSTMEAKKIKNLYFAGECLDLDALTGGYNLQIAFSTGYLAGLCASQI
ncbi:MAG: aminoacetone oxidase family FAD-binding enzyme, partial [Filifactor alocis]|nr:aminoacetone oxidase family FAD-binding enzyme [Filifactor alocis]